MIRNLSTKSPKTTAAAHPGRALRAIRAQNGWTLADVSKRTGIAISVLSKIENEKVSPTFVKLAAISHGLGIDIAQLFTPSIATGAPSASGRRSVTRAAEGQWIETGSYRQFYPAADFLNKLFSPNITELRVRSLQQWVDEFGGMTSHPGEEFTYVLEGEIDLYSALYAPLRLMAGDSIYFDSGMAHAYVACGSAPARLLSINSIAERQATSGSVLAAEPTVGSSSESAQEVSGRTERARRRRAASK